MPQNWSHWYHIFAPLTEAYDWLIGQLHEWSRVQTLLIKCALYTNLSKIGTAVPLKQDSWRPIISAQCVFWPCEHHISASKLLVKSANCFFLICAYRVKMASSGRLEMPVKVKCTSLCDKSDSVCCQQHLISWKVENGCGVKCDISVEVSVFDSVLNLKPYFKDAAFYQ